MFPVDHALITLPAGLADAKFVVIDGVKYSVIPQNKK